MEDFLGIAILVIFYLIAAANGSKKKKNKKQSRASRRRGAAFDRAFSQAQEELDALMQVKPSGAEQEDGEKPQQEPCDTRRMHLHEVSQQQFSLAGEGEDPCHAGEAPDKPEELFSYDEEQAQQSELAQDVLRGVIMSEILTRPCHAGKGRIRGGR